MNNVTFDQIAIGRKFKTVSEIVYKKLTAQQAQPVIKKDGTVIVNGKITTAFYNSPIKVTEVI